MSPELIMLNRKDRKTRKHWLTASVCLFLIYPFLIFVLEVGINSYSQLPQETSPELINQMIRGIALGIIQFSIILHCAYIKFGKGLLTLWLVTSPITILRSLFDDLDPSSLNELVLVAMAIDLAVRLWWCILSLKLRKINKKIQGIMGPKIRIGTLTS